MIYENNMNALKERFDEIYNFFADKREYQDIVTSEICDAKNGDKIVAVQYKGERIFLNSRYNSYYAADKYMEQYYDMPEKSILVMYGFSNASYIKQFFKNKKNDVKVIVYEPSIEIFKSVIENIDISELLKNENFLISVYLCNKEQFNSYLYDVSTINLKYNKIAIAPRYNEIFKEECDEFCRIITEKYKNLYICMNTMAFKGEKIVLNGLNNMRFLPGCRSGEDYKNIFDKDMPAIIVSAGPSLEKNVDLLREVKGKALIIAVDRTVQMLVKRGIIPDMFVSIDNSKTIDLFDVDGIDDMVFFSDMSLNTEVLDFVKSKNLVFYSADSMLWDKLFRAVGSEIRAMNLGGSVALDAIGNAINMGLKNIIMIGQDCALAGTQMYADQVENIYKRKTVMVKGMFGEDVATYPDMLTFIRAIEEIAYNFKKEGVTIIDATEGGAYKEYTEIMTFREAIDKYCTKEYPIGELLLKPKRLFEGEDKKLIVNSLNKSKETLNQVREKCFATINMCEEGIRILKTKKNKISRLKTINKKIDELDNKILDIDESIFITKYVSAEEYKYTLDFYSTDENHVKESIRMYQKSKNYYKAVTECIPKLIEAINNCLDSLECVY